MIANLPLLFAGGCPTSLAKMTMHELECFVTFLVHCSWGHDTAKSIQQPQWWPPDVIFSDPFNRPSTVPKDWTSKLRDLITRCYTYHNSEFLLKFSEELSLNPPSKLQYVDNCDRTTSLYERTSGKLLVTFRNENMMYDRKAEGNRKCLLPKRHVTPESVVENIIADIYLCDTCDEVFDNLEDIKQHEKECSERPRSPDILCLSPEPYEEEEEIGQERFMEIMGLRHVTADVPTSTVSELNDKNNSLSKHRQRRSKVVSNLTYFPFSSLTGMKFNKLRHQTEEPNKRDTLERYCPAPPLCLEVPRWLTKPRPHVYPSKYKKTDNYWNRYHRFPHQRNKLLLELNSYLLYRDCKPVSVKVQPITDKQVSDYLEELSKQKIANEKARIERELAENSYDHDIEFVCVSVCAKQPLNRKRYSNKSVVNRTIKIEPNSGPSARLLSSSSIDIIDLCSDDDDQVETSENADPYPVACHASDELKSQHISLTVASESSHAIKDIPHLEAAYPTLINEKSPLGHSTPCGNSRNSDSKVFPLKEYHINSPNSIILID